MTRLCAAAFALVLVGCEFDETVISQTAPTLVIHSVLNPDQPQQVALVEETLTGRVRIDTTLAYDPSDPIRSGGGIPVSGATVTISRTNAAGTVIGSATGVEDTVLGGTGARGTGVYRVASTIFVPGGTYTLRVAAPDGRVVTGRTRIPGPVTRLGSVLVPDTLDRLRDTLRLSWSAAPGARTNAIRVDTPRGPWFLFNDSTSFALSGSLKNFFQEGLPNVFVPGHRQSLSVIAVDTSFFDYYRSGNDPFSGSGLISKLDGGIGLFGAALPMVERLVSVTQSTAAPLDAEWTSANDSLSVWLESPGPTISATSGRFRGRGPAGSALEAGAIGTLRGSDLRLVVQPEYNSDTLGVFVGRVFADSIVGTWSPAPAGAPARITGPRTYRRGGAPRAP
jgi:hypothetical protein